MTVSVGPGTKGTKTVASRFPVSQGLTLGTTKIENKRRFLVPKVSKLGKNSFVGIY